ncbi:MAG TPA: tetratricopeptide repeat protein, partial [Myxococcota bacterium]|nr:tetratricopeptide repeat protein [Myxococcota bacterium]
MHHDRPVALRLRARLRAALALVAVGAAACGPGDPLEQVRELQTQGRFEESVAPAQLLLEQRGDDPEVQYRYGLALARTGQLSGALFALRRAMESRDWLVTAGLEAGRTELATDNAEGAVAAMDLVLAAEPDHLDALLLRARALATARNAYERGLADADRALELDPGNIEGMTLRVVNLLGLVRVEDAEKQLGELENATRDADDEASTTFVCAMRAVLAKEKGDREDATRRFDACLAASPADSELIGQAIKFYDETGQPEKAVELLRKAVAESPASAWVRRGLAERLRRAGEIEEAERVLREGTQIA